MDVQTGMHFFKKEKFHVILRVQLKSANSELLENPKVFDVLGDNGEIRVKSGQSIFLYNKRFTLTVNSAKKIVLLNDPQKSSDFLVLSSMLDSNFLGQISKVYSERDSAGNKVYRVDFLPGYHCKFWKIALSEDNSRFLQTELLMSQLLDDGSERVLNLSTSYHYQDSQGYLKSEDELFGNDIVEKRKGKYILKNAYSSYVLYNYLNLN